MKVKNQNRKTILLGSLGILFGGITIFLNVKVYIGYLTLFPGIIALLFSFLSYRNTIKKTGMRIFAIVTLTVSVFSIFHIFMGELKTKHSEKIEFIDEFSNDIDDEIRKTQKDSSSN